MRIPNPLLSYDEALLIFRHVTSAVRYLRSVVEIEEEAEGPIIDNDLPF